MFLYLCASSKTNILFFRSCIPIQIMPIVAIFFMRNARLKVIFCILLIILKLNNRNTIHQITVPITAPAIPRLKTVMNVIIDIAVISNPIANIFVLCLTFPVPANIQKLMVNKILMMRNGLEYISNSPEWRNFWPKSMVVICGHNMKNSPHMLKAKTEKYL